MKFPPDFHDYTELNGLLNFFSYCSIAPPNKLFLGCKPHWSAKREKKNVMSELVTRTCSAKKLSWKFRKIRRMQKNVAGLQAFNFIKKGLKLRCFPANFVKLLITRFLQNTSGWLVLVFSSGIWEASQNTFL